MTGSTSCKANLLTPPKWHAYNYPKNLEKQELPKLLVPRLVLSLFCSMDLEGRFYLDNVDVGGILVTDPAELPYLAAVLNSPVANFVWRRISKPFQNAYRSANRQFIAPLPIPDAAPTERRRLSGLALRLQELHTQRRDLVDRLERRLQSAQTVEAARAPDWLWADIGTVASWKACPQAPANLAARDLTAWAQERVRERFGHHLAELDALLRPGADLAVEVDADEVRVLVNRQPVLTRYGLPDAPLIAAQWRQALRDVRVTEAFDAKKLLGVLLNLRTTGDANLAQVITDLDREIATMDGEIAALEKETNLLVYRLYGIQEPGIVAMVEGRPPAPAMVP